VSMLEALIYMLLLDNILLYVSMSKRFRDLFSPLKQFLSSWRQNPTRPSSHIQGAFMSENPLVLTSQWQNSQKQYSYYLQHQSIIYKENATQTLCPPALLTPTPPPQGISRLFFFTVTYRNGFRIRWNSVDSENDRRVAVIIIARVTFCPRRVFF